jgi:secondary thiamine-phosphate synthase enzyme
MQILTKQFFHPTRGGSEVIDITEKVNAVLLGSGLKEGSLTVFVMGSTASITTTEFEPGLRRDIPEMLNRIASNSERYHHDDTWHDGNGHSHVRAALMGCSITIPFLDGGLMLGTWQQIVLVDHDNRARQRTIVVQIVGQ